MIQFTCSLHMNRTPNIPPSKRIHFQMQVWKAMGIAPTVWGDKSVVPPCHPLLQDSLLMVLPLCLTMIDGVQRFRSNTTVGRHGKPDISIFHSKGSKVLYKKYPFVLCCCDKINAQITFQVIIIILLWVN